MDFDLKNFRKTNDGAALKVAGTSLLPFFIVIWLSYQLYAFSYVWVLVLAFPAHWFHARIFIVMHDCGHRSFARSNFLNELLGHLAAFCFLTPFLMWRQLHNRHHKYQGNLDKRGKSLDVWMLTTDEFAAASPWKKIVYRLYRNPFIFFIVGPFALFVGVFRFPFESFNRIIIFNILLLNVLLIVVGYGALQNSVLLKMILVLLPTLTLSFVLAVMLFYVQHQYEETIWFYEADFDFVKIGLQGSSFIQMPSFLNWWTGNIAYHHVHHLDVKIPMYELAQAHEYLKTKEDFSQLHWTSLGPLTQLKLWDTKIKKMVPYQKDL